MNWSTWHVASYTSKRSVDFQGPVCIGDSLELSLFGALGSSACIHVCTSYVTVASLPGPASAFVTCRTASDKSWAGPGNEAML